MTKKEKKRNYITISSLASEKSIKKKCEGGKKQKKNEIKTRSDKK